MNTSVISVVGAGGKTTLLHRLEDECVRKKQHVIITTTTKIMHENKPYFLEDTSIGKIKDTLGKFGRVWIGSRDLISGKTAPHCKRNFRRDLLVGAADTGRSRRSKTTSVKSSRRT
ncbi:MAG: hypothetical protein ACLR7J_07030 [[Ruminococcus] torques]